MGQIEVSRESKSIDLEWVQEFAFLASFCWIMMLLVHGRGSSRTMGDHILKTIDMEHCNAELLSRRYLHCAYSPAIPAQALLFME